MAFASVCSQASHDIYCFPGNDTSSLVKKLYWTKEEDEWLTLLVEHNGDECWEEISKLVTGRTPTQCKKRWEGFLSPDLVRGPWTKEEDEKVISLVQRCGTKRWSYVSTFLKGRTGKQCRERWHNHLDPEVNKTAWTEAEDQMLYQLHVKYGNKWAKIAKHFKGRTDNSIKNHWHSTIKRKLQKSCEEALADQLESEALTSNVIPVVQIPLNENEANRKSLQAITQPQANYHNFTKSSKEFEGNLKRNLRKVIIIKSTKWRPYDLGEPTDEIQWGRKEITHMLPNQGVSQNEMEVDERWHVSKVSQSRCNFARRLPNDEELVRGISREKKAVEKPFDNNLEMQQGQTWWYRIACGLTETQLELTGLARKLISSWSLSC